MRVKISLVILILLSFFNIGAVSNIHLKDDSFSSFESIYLNKSEFIENGSKIQYKTKNSIENEKNRIEKYINNKCVSDYKEVNNKISFDNHDMHAEAYLWNDDIYTYAEITIVNSRPNYKTEDLIGVLKGLENKDLNDVQYYQYYKGRISFDREDEYTIDICNSIHNADMINLNNGYTGSGYCTDGEKINFAISNYDTGAYIIIGTPIIFATY
ncbi:hypothetical protein [uncultured Clostridium sp.]|uniref:hypothetical protein n=1 Tax=uncultured Clostridium sp. TaxID=59620 RepID=UPI0025E3D9EF|nr:hypothetical protein [uncultured Clostridium sp.]